MEDIDFLISLLNNKKSEESKSNKIKIVDKLSQINYTHNEGEEDGHTNYTENVILPMLKNNNKI